VSDEGQCLDADAVARFVEGDFDVKQCRKIEAHLDRCEACRTWVSAVAFSEGAPSKDEPTVPPPVFPAEDLAKAGSSVGRYVLLRRIGAGGMGVVAKAYDPELDRHVAIKILRQPLTTESARRRQLREARAMARVTHPNVVAVHDVGVHEDRLFIAMELVDGVDLATWVREQPRTVAEILEVCRDVGRGIVEAHASGLVHRDLKPGNVLVPRGGAAKVADFGLAQSVDADGASGRAVVGTPGFMAPEQYGGGAVDARTDQFGFCATLYAALYGVPPFRGETTAETRRATEQGSPSLPAREGEVPPRVRRALLRGLRPNPAQRFATMSALLRELGPPRRRARIVGLAGLAVVIGGFGVHYAVTQPSMDCSRGVEQLEAVWNDATKDQIGEAFRGTAVAYAHTAAERATKVLDDTVTEWTEAHAETCRARITGRASERLTENRLDCLERRRHRVEVMVERFTTADDAVVRRAVSVADSVGDPWVCLDRGLDLQAPTDHVAEVEAVRVHLTEAVVAIRTDDLARAQSALDEARNQAEAIDFPPLLAELVIVEGRLADARREPELAIERLHEAVTLAEASHYDEAALEARVRLLVVVAEQPGKLDTAREMAKLAEGAILRSPVNRLWARTEIDRGLGHALTIAEHGEEAVSVFERALDRLGSDRPLHRAQVERGLAAALVVGGELERSRKHFEQSCRILVGRLGQQHPSALRCLMGLAAAHVDAGQPEAARRRFDRVRLAEIASLGPDHPAVATTEMNLALVLRLLGETASAIPLAEHAVEVRTMAFGEKSLAAGRALRVLGLALVDVGAHEEALDVLTRGRIAVETQMGPDAVVIVAQLEAEGLAQLALERYEDARLTFERAIDVLEKTDTVDGAEAISIYNNHGFALLELGRIDPAIEAVKRAVALAERHLPADHPNRVDTQRSLASALYEADRASEATTVLEPVLEILEHQPHRAEALADARVMLAETLSHGDPPDRERILALIRKARTHADADLERRINALEAGRSTPLPVHSP